MEWVGGTFFLILKFAPVSICDGVEESLNEFFFFFANIRECHFFFKAQTFPALIKRPMKLGSRPLAQGR